MGTVPESEFDWLKDLESAQHGSDPSFATALNVCGVFAAVRDCWELSRDFDCRFASSCAAWLRRTRI
ncbi:unnamed protein product [Zymoseptoria tritici ST99CH_3D7]|uniref:Uncharacterized protein n=1 Tax=Zymoseptoria tritici (strain ST99CH_3D7) TaxID=1276538 RepID=A0A1X7SAF7_ZYMT9|nr:unnamed protein product [Zymoseptoria tritici ST99CH_3D7]